MFIKIIRHIFGSEKRRFELLITKCNKTTSGLYSGQIFLDFSVLFDILVAVLIRFTRRILRRLFDSSITERIVTAIYWIEWKVMSKSYFFVHLTANADNGRFLRVKYLEEK